eukprot:CAMPEP_0172851142 /NCGR_PEP_ID=MMETSP1075-20121228/51475_1 /TAXON_ID=2916 /ORGANISM="Ceratium fusus, Strain PA161109" /LENGTH=55 /DNA_ID=CAMNT_0013697139 /DNA_START=192 /DNA_END=355 /DNA_ORIENTATION=+
MPTRLKSQTKWPSIGALTPDASDSLVLLTLMLKPSPRGAMLLVADAICCDRTKQS